MRQLNAAIRGVGKGASIGSGLNAAQGNIRAMQTGINGVNGAVGKLATGFNTASNAAASVAGGIARGIITPLQKAVGLAGRVGSSLRRAGSGIGGIGKGLATGAALGATVFGIGSLREATSWQEALAKINTIANDDAEQLAKVSKNLQDMSVEFGISTADMATAQYEFLSAGIGLFKTYNKATGEFKQTHDDMVAGVKQGNIAMEAAAKFSIASLSTQTEAVTLLSFALNAYNLNQKSFSADVAKQAGVFDHTSGAVDGYARSMGEASQVIGDMFAKAVEIGVVKGPEIARSFATVAASAKQAGIGIDEIAAAYASQTVRGVSAARVTTSMNRAILDLLRPGKQLQELMASTGRNYAKLADTKGLHVALQQMRTDAKAAGIEYGTLFKRQEGLRFALNITQDDLKDTAGNFFLYKLALDEVRKSTEEGGTSQQQMERRMHTVSREIDRVRFAFQILQQTVGTPLLEPFRNLLVAIKDVEVHLINMGRSKAGQKFIEQMGPIIGVVSLLLSLTAGTQGLLFVFQRIAPVFGTTATNLRVIGIILGKIVLPIAVLIGLLGTFKFLVENNIRGFGQFSSQLDDMKSVAQGVIVVFQTIAVSLTHLWNTIGRGGDAWAAVSLGLDQIGQAVENIGPAFERVLRFVAAFALSLGQAIVEVLVRAIPAIAGWFVSVAKAIVPKIAYLLGVFVGWAKRVVPQIVANLGDFARSVVAWLQKAIPQVLQVLGLILSAILAWAFSVIPTILGAIGDLGAEFISWVRTAIPVVVRGVGEFIDQLRANLSRSGPSIVASFSAWAKSIGDWFANDLFPQVQRGLSAFINGVGQFLKDTQLVRRIVNFLVTAIVGIAALIASHAGEIVDVVVEIARQAVAGFTDFFQQHGGELLAAGLIAGAKILGGIAAFIIQHPGDVITAVATMWAVAATAGAVLAAVGRVRALLTSSLVPTQGQSLIQAGLVRILALAWQGAQKALVAIVAFAGAAAGPVYAAGVKVAEFLVAVLSAVWRFIAGNPVILASAGAAGAAAGTAYASAMGATSMALAAPMAAQTTLLLGSGLESSVIVVSNQSRLMSLIWNLGFKFGSLIRLGLLAGLVLLAADIAEKIKEATDPVAHQIHDSLMNLNLPLPNIDWNGMFKNAPWPIGPARPDWLNSAPGWIQTILEDGFGVDTKEEAAAKKLGQTLGDSVGDGLKLSSESWRPILNGVPLAPNASTGFSTAKQSLHIGDILNGGSVKHEASQFVKDMLVDPFKKGLDDGMKEIPKFDWGSILGVSYAKQSANDITDSVSGTMTNLHDQIVKDTPSITEAVKKWLPNPKTGKFDSSQFKSDADRIKSINGSIRSLRTSLAEALKVGDSKAVVQIQEAIDQLKTQRHALETVKEEADAARKKLEEAPAFLNRHKPGYKPPAAPKPTTTKSGSMSFDSQPSAGPRPPATVKEPTVGSTGFTLPRYMQMALSGELLPPPKPTRIKVESADKPGQSIDSYIANAVTRSQAATIAVKTNVDGTNKTIDQYIADATTSISTLGATATTATSTVASTVATAQSTFSGLPAAANAAVAGANTAMSTLPASAATTATQAAGSFGAALATGSGAVASGAQSMTNAVVRELDNANTSAGNLGLSAALRFASGLLSGILGDNGVAAAAQGVANTVTAILQAGSWRSYGERLVHTFADGMLDGLHWVRAAALTVAHAAAGPIYHNSPAKFGPLKAVPAWGHEMVRQFALGMKSAKPILKAQALSTAGAATIPFSGAREIAPMSMGTGRSYGGDDQQRHNQASMDRQIELLADIASATRIGAAASSRGASRDPRAGGPLAARSALVSLKQLTTSRARGGS